MNTLKSWLKTAANKKNDNEIETTPPIKKSKLKSNSEETLERIEIEAPSTSKKFKLNSNSVETLENEIEIEDAQPSKKSKLDFNSEEALENSVTKSVSVPYFLTEEKIKKLKNNHDWLIIKNDAMGCSTCKEVNDLKIFSEKNLRLSKAWQNCSVAPNGKTISSQQSSVRKKIYEHRNSDAHKKASEILEQSAKNEINTNIENMQKNNFLNTERVFRTVYKIAKHQRPFVDLPVDVDLQKLNGISMGNILHSDKTCSEIAIHISSEMKKRICTEIASKRYKISVLIDESTALSKFSTLVVVIRTFFADFPGDAYVFNLDLLELSDTSASNITVELLNCLYKHGFDEAFLKECFIGFACDGASVMLGKNAGVATLLKQKFPNLIIWHCANHRLELAVYDAINEVSGINHFKIFIDKLYSLYHQSPKNQRELKEVAVSLNVQLLKIGKIFSIRWISSSSRTVKAVLNNYAALFEHFTQASNDRTRDEKERCKYKGLNKILTNSEFVKNLHMMADALEELTDLSLFLQKRNITLIEADKAVKTTIRVFDSMVNNYGSRLSNVISDLNLKKFKGVPLHEANLKSINVGQFYRSLANNLQDRMITTKSSHASQNEKTHLENTNTYNNFLNYLKVLNPKTWPKNDDEEVDMQFGEEEIRALCKLFILEEKEIIRGFRQFKMDENEVPEDLKPLFKAVATIPISTSECERNFSSMNEILTPLRSSLSINTVAALLFINSVGPPLCQFKPENYIRSWLAKGHHLADDTNSRKRELKKDDTFIHLWKLL